MSKCTSVLKGMPWCQGKPVLPGVRRRAYFIAYDDILKWPELTRDEMGRATTATYTGNFTLAESAKF